ncbi:MAG: hypothetical protein AUJ23_00160 [Candidatus Magasanikbacteria bacterium CG1_02_32_51]|uniref:Thioredoxin-like fold domain-containing protein n=1 Tax=Candidatus Magasanikbacteria bacterium CG1_02_32_51 TaxID=1805238 RepID=A0A1J4UE73_9BACT|nr:MAG: hypothetical protein AUJ23_00160 [Candidatus Magasanikbacteria bacterium CG1_02_32_51]
MLSTKKILTIFIPALLIVGLAFFVQIIKYQPLFPKVLPQDNTPKQFVIPLFPEDPIIGNPKSPITIIAFEDFSCGECSRQNDIFEILQTKYPNKFKVIWKGLPISDFPYPSINAEKYGYCANQQNKFADFKTNAFVNTLELSETTLQVIAQNIELDEKQLNKCLSSEEVTNFIKITENIAQILSVQAVPAFFIDNKQISKEDTASEYAWETLLGLSQ